MTPSEKLSVQSFISHGGSRRTHISIEYNAALVQAGQRAGMSLYCRMNLPTMDSCWHVKSIASSSRHLQILRTESMIMVAGGRELRSLDLIVSVPPWN